MGRKPPATRTTPEDEAEAFPDASAPAAGPRHGAACSRPLGSPLAAATAPWEGTDGMGWDGIGHKGTGWDGMAWEGAGGDGKGREGMGWDRIG